MNFLYNCIQSYFIIIIIIICASTKCLCVLGCKQEFNAGLFDYLIATDDSEIKEKETAINDSNKKLKKSRKNAKQKLDFEFGVVRGIDFKNVFTVCLHFYDCAAGLLFDCFSIVNLLFLY